MDREELLPVFSLSLREIFGRLNLDFDRLQEIRLRAGRPILIRWDGREFFVRQSGEAAMRPEDGYCPSHRELQETLEYLSGFSLYAYEEELRQGFMTVRGGHRVGVAGQAVLEHGRVKTIRNISFLNFRIAHEVPGCADSLLPWLTENGRLCNTLLISPPMAGKTTLLRDLIRRISDGTEELPGKSVGVVDERSELGGCVMGIPQKDLGIRTDVLDGCSKAEGMMMLVRSMAPEVLAVDEIGTESDVKALEDAARCGCALIATVHGSGMEDLIRRPGMKKLFEHCIFERYLLLENRKCAGKLQAVYDGYGELLWGEPDLSGRFREETDLCRSIWKEMDFPANAVEKPELSGRFRKGSDLLRSAREKSDLPGSAVEKPDSSRNFREGSDLLRSAWEGPDSSGSDQEKMDLLRRFEEDTDHLRLLGRRA